MNSNNVPKFLVNMLEKQYGREITEQILEGYCANRVVSLRVNTLKSSVEEVIDEFIKTGIEYKTVSWNAEAFIIDNANEAKIQELNSYKEGKIYLQSLSSMLPPIILNPIPYTDILDMTAAPGGKTTQMAAITKNKAHITACEMNKVRAERLKYNIEKQGATCVYTMTKDARTIDDFFSFDQILLDAPCSGSGTINSNDENISNVFTEKLISKSTNVQLLLLKKAVKILKPGHEMVYSTCSILSCENEDIISKVADGKKIEIVPIELDEMDKIPMLPTKINGTLCVAPNKLYEGFFVAKLRRNF